MLGRNNNNNNNNSTTTTTNININIKQSTGRPGQDRRTREDEKSEEDDEDGGQEARHAEDLPQPHLPPHHLGGPDLVQPVVRVHRDVHSGVGHEHGCLLAGICSGGSGGGSSSGGGSGGGGGGSGGGGDGGA